MGFKISSKIVPLNKGTALETMGDRIRRLREARGLTQMQLGDLCQVSHAAVSQWENGATANVKLQTFLTLCDVLYTDPHYLIYGETRKRSPGPGGVAKGR